MSLNSSNPTPEVSNDEALHEQYVNYISPLRHVDVQSNSEANI
jgi:hypothetical protein